MLPGPYVGSYLGEKGHKYLQETRIIELAKSVELFLLVSISGIPNIKYWKNLRKNMNTAKENIPKQCIIGDTCLYVIGNYWREFIHKTSKNLNCVHKDSNDLLSVIITLGTDAHDGKIFFKLEWLCMTSGKEHMFLIICT